MFVTTGADGQWRPQSRCSAVSLVLNQLLQRGQGGCDEGADRTRRGSGRLGLYHGETVLTEQLKAGSTEGDGQWPAGSPNMMLGSEVRDK